MINQINEGTTIQPSENETFVTNTRITSSQNCVVKNCVFKYVDGSALDMTGGNNTLQDCYLSYIETVCNLTSVMTTVCLKGDNNIIRQNTIHKTGASSQSVRQQLNRRI